VRYSDVHLFDRIVPDAAPLQVLGPGHALNVTDELEVEELARGRRLVSIGELSSWLAEPEPESLAVAHGRRVLESLLPSRDELIRLRTTSARPQLE
jgi:hypothetical protein